MDDMMIHDLFRSTLDRSRVDQATIDRLWTEITDAYSSKGRHYHDLQHLEHLATVLQPHWSAMQNTDAIVFAIAYHDIVYKVTRTDNEEKSADLMRERLAQLSLPAATIDRAYAHILATKAHTATADPDTAYFTDADLSILGADPENYDRYAKAVRQEYRRYPDLLYKPGRRKVLQHFLAMPRIFRTAAFHGAFEEKGRRNLQAEIEQLR